MMFGPTLPLLLVALPLVVGVAVSLYGIASWFRRAPATIARVAVKATGSVKAITTRATGSVKAITAPAPRPTPAPIAAPTPRVEPKRIVVEPEPIAVRPPVVAAVPEPVVGPELSAVLSTLGEPTAVGLPKYVEPEDTMDHLIADIRATPPPAAVLTRAPSPHVQPRAAAPRAPTPQPQPRAPTPQPRVPAPAPRAATPAPRAGTPPPQAFDDDQKTQLAGRSVQLAPSRVSANVQPAKPKRPRAFAVGSEKFPVQEDAEFDDAFDNAFDAVLTGEPSTVIDAPTAPRRR